jgi:DNA (cytosine-5)-methyltransferase 1
MIKLLYIDLFCGAGGTTTGVELAKIGGEKCAKVIACVNHDANAIASHAANHPDCKHFTEDIRTLDVKPLKELLDQERKNYPEAKTVLWASLECTNFSRAKGGKARDADSRTLANHLYRYIETLTPDVIQIENVEEFMAWGKLDENGKPVDWHKGSDYIKWIRNVENYGYNYDWRIMNAADYGAYTSRKRLFGQFVKRGMRHSFPMATHTKKISEEKTIFPKMHKWKPVREVLDLKDEGESIFLRKKPLCEKTLERIYAGMIKFIANGYKNFIIKYNSMNQKGKYTAPSIDEPCPTIATQQRIAIAKGVFLSKQYSGDEKSKNISVEAPAGTITTKDHHALISYYGAGGAIAIDKPSPTLTTKDRLAKVSFIANEYSAGGQVSSIESVSPAILTKTKQKLVSCDKFLVNPQYKNKGGSIDEPSFTLIARMDKMPPYIVFTEQGIGITIYEDDSPATKKIKKFMAIYGLIDIRMRMLKISELKAIMGFPKDYVLIGTQSEQKKYIGNAVEVNMSKALCEALAEEN